MSSPRHLPLLWLGPLLEPSGYADEGRSYLLALERGDWVISDRFTDASFAYQGGGRKLPLEKLRLLEQWVHPGIQPDLTLLFDVPLDIARQRLDKHRTLDKFEQEQQNFFAEVRRVYLQRAQEFPERMRVIDSSQPLDDVSRQLEQLVAAL